MEVNHRLVLHIQEAVELFWRRNEGAPEVCPESLGLGHKDLLREHVEIHGHALPVVAEFIKDDEAAEGIQMVLLGEAQGSVVVLIDQLCLLDKRDEL